MTTIGRLRRLYWLALVALALATQASVRAQDSTDDGKTVLVVSATGQPVPGSEDDVLVRHLQASGYVVLVKPSAEFASADALGISVVVVSNAAGQAGLGETLRDVSTAVVTLRGETFPELGMTGPKAKKDWGVTSSVGVDLEIKDAGQPMAAGLSGVVHVSDGPSWFAWGAPNGSTVFEVASLSSGEALIFAYEQGTEMAKATAPARRAAIGLSPSAMTIDGWMLFDAAVAWAAVKNHPPTVDAGPDLEAEVGEPVWLFGGVDEDDQLPNPPGALRFQWTQVAGPAEVTLADSRNQSAIVQFPGPGSYQLRFMATDGILSGSDDVTILVRPPLGPQGGGKESGGPVTAEALPVPTGVLVVVGTTATSGDNLLIGRLNALGFIPTVKSSSAATSADATGKSLVVITGSAVDSSVGTKFKAVSVPVLVCRKGLATNMSMISGSGTTVGQTQVNIFTPSHPIAAGLTGSVTVENSAQTLDWGTTAASAAKVATILTNSSRATIFAYEAGAAMAGSYAAPARRVGFLGPDAVVGALNSNGLKLFDAAVTWAARSNERPVVNAGSDVTVNAPGPNLSTNVSLNGTVTDDGYPNPPAALTISWSGPAGVTFTNASSPSASAQFSNLGTYVLTLTASDGIFTTTDSMTVTVRAWLDPLNAPPVVSAGPDKTTRPLGLTLTGSVTDDGRPVPPGAVTSQWSVVSGPGTVTFGNAALPQTTAGFSIEGNYVLRLTADDGAAVAYDEVSVTVIPRPVVLLVARNGVQQVPTDPDWALKLHLESIGFAVGIRADSAATAADLSGRALAIISSNAASTTTTFRSNLKTTTVPVIAAHTSVYNPIGMIDPGASGTTSATQATFTDSPMPFASALFGTAPPGTATLTTTSTAYSWATGLPSPFGIATMPGNSTQSPVFAFEKGATMLAATIAPARRAGFFSTASTTFTQQAWTLLDAVVEWAITSPLPALVVQGSGNTGSMKSRLEGLGYTVTAKSDSAVTAADATGKALVAIYHEANPSVVGPKLKNVAVPMLVTGAGHFPAMGLTGATSGVDYGSLTSQTSVQISNPSHVLAAGLTGVQVALSSASTFGWGKPASSGVTAVTPVGYADRSASFFYPRGWPIVGLTAPERRVGLFLTTVSTSSMTPAGWRLFDAAVRWTVNTDNLAPLVDAGPDKTVPAHQAATLTGTVWDDGRPTGSSLSYTWAKVSGPGALDFGSPNSVSTTATPAALGTYVVSLTVSDGSLSTSDQLTLTATAAGASNYPPTINVGPDPNLAYCSTSTSVAATVTDDGLPLSPGTTSMSWSQTSGPGTVQFGNAAASATTVTFPITTGTYVLRGTATDGALSSFDELSVTLPVPPNQAPVVSAGPDQTANATNEAVLTATASDDGYPCGSVLTYGWTPVTLPPGGLASLTSSQLASTRVAFSGAGTYVFRVTVSDGALATTDDVVVTVRPGKDALLVVPGWSSDAAERARRQADAAAATLHLENLDFAVTPILASALGPADVLGRSLIVVLPGIDSAPLLAGTTSPVLVLSANVLDDLGMTASPPSGQPPATTDPLGMQPYQTQISITSASHPLIAGPLGTSGLQNGARQVYLPTPATFGTSGPTGGDMLWGRPAAGAQGVATLVSDATRSTLFAYDVGATLANGLVTQRRRVGFFGRPSLLDATGASLLDHAITWAAASAYQPSVLLVAGSTTLDPAETTLKLRMENLGFTVPVATASGAAIQAMGKDAAVITDTASGTGLSALKPIAIPFITWNTAQYSTLALTGPTAGTDFGSSSPLNATDVLRPLDPLAAGLSGQPQVLDVAAPLSWGAPGTGATQVASVPGFPTRSSVFGYEVGAAMVGLTAPDRRVGLFLSSGAASSLSARGGALFDAALLWAAVSDADNDGLDRRAELRLGTDPGDTDTNDDGISDGDAVRLALSPTSPDMDQDGLTNAAEVAAGTDPLKPDSDGDGTFDGADDFPLDPTQTDAGSSDDNPPGITLMEPADAVLTSSTTGS